MGSVVVAYSGGVDSAYLLSVAHDRLGVRALGVTAVSESLPEAELRDAVALAERIGAAHLTLRTHELEDPNYVANAPNRCYFCKRELFTRLTKLARERGFAWVADGFNLDDVGDFRPGQRAGRELGVRSPLREAELTKAELRTLARERGLPVWDKPALACLSSRLPYGTPVTAGALRQIERAESALRRLGFRACRVRHHDSVARLEVDPADFGRVVELRETIVAELRAAGYAYVALDLLGYRSGAMNEVLPMRMVERR